MRIHKRDELIIKGRGMLSLGDVNVDRNFFEMRTFLKMIYTFRSRFLKVMLTEYLKKIWLDVLCLILRTRNFFIFFSKYIGYTIY